MVSVNDKPHQPVTRPACRYHGGKWRSGKWIRTFFPNHRRYVEPYGGGASVLLQKPPVAEEIYNDLDSRVVGLFRVLRDPSKAKALQRQVALTPFSREELDDSYNEPSDDVDAARRFLVRAYMGHSSDAATRKAKASLRCKRGGGRNSPAIDWSGWPEIVPAVVERLRRVVIENRPAAELLDYYDSPEVLFYCDPPYLHGTRSSLNGKSANGSTGYRYEMSDADHVALVSQLQTMRGMVVLSGYDNDVYRPLLLNGWVRHETRAIAEQGKERVECVWVNPACMDALGLFGGIL